MKYLYLALSVLALGAQAYLYFMLVAFASPGIQAGQRTMQIFDFLLYALPSICVLAGMLTIAGFVWHWEHVYVWTLLPIPFAVIVFFGVLAYMTDHSASVIGNAYDKEKQQQMSGVRTNDVSESEPNAR